LNLVFCTSLVFLLSSCNNNPPANPRFELKPQNRNVPQFDGQRAFDYIQAQVDIGPRNPNSDGHRIARDYLLTTLRGYAGSNAVFAQDFTADGYDETLQLTNVIAAFNLSSSDRILLAAHWDTRPRAEEDLWEDMQDNPILGADDGGSGVGVLLELARIFSENPPPIGVDIIFFDGEDYGHSHDIDRYFLGARYWSANPPVPGYSPRYGILLDMVGGKGATFPKEGYSRRFAPELTENIWKLAKELGYESLFIQQNGGMVADDHLIVNLETDIQMINIIHYTSDGNSVVFPPYWHTHNDTMEIISTETLQAVGDVLVELIYNRIPPRSQP
jgi:glutaminyl-peptide cyclotransferase